jgi:hypothetical protein
MFIITANGNLEKDMVMVFNTGVMVQSTKDNGLMIWLVVKVD